MDVIITHEWFKKKNQRCPLCWWLPKGINIWFYHCILYVLSYIIKLVMLTASHSSHLVFPLRSFVFSHPWHSTVFNRIYSEWIPILPLESLLISMKNLCRRGFSCAAYISRQVLELLVVWPRLIPTAFSYASL